MFRRLKNLKTLCLHMPKLRHQVLHCNRMLQIRQTLGLPKSVLDRSRFHQWIQKLQGPFQVHCLNFRSMPLRVSMWSKKRSLSHRP